MTSTRGVLEIYVFFWLSWKKAWWRQSENKTSALKGEKEKKAFFFLHPTHPVSFEGVCNSWLKAAFDFDSTKREREEERKKERKSESWRKSNSAEKNDQNSET